MKNIIALIIDFRSTQETARLSCQITSGNDLGNGLGRTFSLKVFHVDNGNTDPVTLTPQQIQQGVGLLRLPKNDGYAGGILGALHKLETELGSESPAETAYWFLNSDLEVAPDCLNQLVRVLDQNPRVGAAGPVVYFGHGPKIWGARGVVNPLLGITAMTEWPNGGILPQWSYIPGCSILVRQSAYQEAGGMPERYRMYYEETELCVKMQKTGWDLFVEPQARAYHHVNSMEERIPAKHFAYYFSRNNLYFWKSNFGIPPLLQLPRTLLVTIKELVLPLRRAKSFGIFSERMGYILAGLFDSLAFLKQRYTFFEKRLFLKNQKEGS